MPARKNSGTQASGKKGAKTRAPASSTGSTPQRPRKAESAASRPLIPFEQMTKDQKERYVEDALVYQQKIWEIQMATQKNARKEAVRQNELSADKKTAEIEALRAATEAKKLHNKEQEQELQVKKKFAIRQAAIELQKAQESLWLMKAKNRLIIFGAATGIVAFGLGAASIPPEFARPAGLGVVVTAIVGWGALKKRKELAEWWKKIRKTLSWRKAPETAITAPELPVSLP